MKMRALFAILAALAAVAGCSSSSQHPRASTSTATPRSSTSAYSPSPADDAATIASHIPGCTMVLDDSVGGGGPDMTSTASCIFEGHMVIVDVWGGAASQAIPAALTKDRPPVFYAVGEHWTAFLADEGATPDTTTLQMQLTNDAAGLLGAIPKTPVPGETQQALTALIAKALGGDVART